MSNLMKLQEVAKRLGVSEKSARRYVKSGEIPSVFVGNAYRISEQDLVEYLEHARVRAGESGPKVQSPLPLDEPERAPGIEAGEAYFVEPEEGEEPDILTLRVNYVWLLEENDRLLKEVRELARENRELKNVKSASS